MGKAEMSGQKQRAEIGKTEMISSLPLSVFSDFSFLLSAFCF
jgi:hypothetical protein